jgi:DNA invertase Pin-like site-specific DNA recombinase
LREKIGVRSLARIVALPDRACQSDEEKVTAMNQRLRRIGYLRISVQRNVPNAQPQSLKQTGYTDIRQSTEGGPFATPTARRQLLDLLTNGGELIVYRLDRLGRDEHNVVNLQQQLEAMGVTLIVTSDEAAGGDDA